MPVYCPECDAVSELTADVAAAGVDRTVCVACGCRFRVFPGGATAPLAADPEEAVVSPAATPRRSASGGWEDEAAVYQRHLSAGEFDEALAALDRAVAGGGPAARVIEWRRAVDQRRDAFLGLERERRQHAAARDWGELAVVCAAMLRLCPAAETAAADAARAQRAVAELPGRREAFEAAMREGEAEQARREMAALAGLLKVEEADALERRLRRFEREFPPANDKMEALRRANKLDEAASACRRLIDQWCPESTRLRQTLAEIEETLKQAEKELDKAHALARDGRFDEALAAHGRATAAPQARRDEVMAGIESLRAESIRKAHEAALDEALKLAKQGRFDDARSAWRGSEGLDETRRGEVWQSIDRAERQREAARQRDEQRRRLRLGLRAGGALVAAVGLIWVALLVPAAAWPWVIVGLGGASAIIFGILWKRSFSFSPRHRIGRIGFWSALPVFLLAGGWLLWTHVVPAVAELPFAWLLLGAPALAAAVFGVVWITYRDNCRGMGVKWGENGTQISLLLLLLAGLFLGGRFLFAWIPSVAWPAFVEADWSLTLWLAGIAAAMILIGRIAALARGAKTVTGIGDALNQFGAGILLFIIPPALIGGAVGHFFLDSPFLLGCKIALLASAGFAALLLIAGFVEE